MSSLCKTTFIILLTCFFHFATQAQLGHSPYVQSVINLTDIANLKLIIRQLSGDTSVVINGQTDTLTSRYFEDPQNELVTQYISDKFMAYGYVPEIQYFNEGRGANVIATKTGTIYPDQYFILSAHYDSFVYENTSVAPGADDNASGMAALLEAARLFSDIPSLYSIKFIAFDEEETGLEGSSYFAEQARQSGMIIPALINLDMFGYTSDDDFEYDLCRENNYSTLSLDLASSVNYYYPQLRTNFSDCDASDHYSFWQNGFQAISIVEAHSDFSPYYHTAEDLIIHYNFEYYFSLVKSVYSTLLARVLEYRYDLSHDPLPSVNSTEPRIAELMVKGYHPVASGTNVPGLYFSTDGVNYTFMAPFETEADTFRYLIPGFSYGTIVNYYFAVQDADSRFSMTLPAGGYGLNPPGSVAPSETFSYLVDALFTLDKCSPNIPMAIPANDTISDEFVITDIGRVHDVDLTFDITHKTTREISIFLTSPDNTTVLLLEKVGGTGDNFTQTVLDDDADTLISDGLAPFTGRYRPLNALSSFRNKYTDGAWKLSIGEVNTYFPDGVLNSWCLHFMYVDTTVGMEKSLPFHPEVKCFPNPAKDKLELKILVNESATASVKIYDQTGHLMRDIGDWHLISGNNLLVTTLNDMRAGIYYLRVHSKDYTSTSKLVVLR